MNKGDQEGGGLIRILIVDDLADAARSLAMLCEMRGAKARVAANGVEALHIGTEFRPDVVLMDITMPYMDGYEAARQVRQQEWGKSTLMLALTGWGRPSDVEAATAAGFDGHLLKPVDSDSLLSTLRAHGIQGI